MADYCCICDTRRPAGVTNLLVLNGGEFWLEFCQFCADEPITNAETGETIAVGTLWARANGEPDPGITPRATSYAAERMAQEAAMEAFYQEQEDWERKNTLPAPTWYERLEEFICDRVGAGSRRVHNLKAIPTF